MTFNEILKSADKEQNNLSIRHDVVEYCLNKAEVMNKRAKETLNPTLRKQYKKWYHFYMCRAMGIQRERG